jgi:hypothetical protein
VIVGNVVFFAIVLLIAAGGAYLACQREANARGAHGVEFESG